MFFKKSRARKQYADEQLRLYALLKQVDKYASHSCLCSECKISSHCIRMEENLPENAFAVDGIVYIISP